MKLTFKLLTERWFFGLLIFFGFQASLLAQEDCSTPFAMEQGYTTTISQVVQNVDGSHTITLIVENDGCQGCKKLNRYSVQASAGTYSDIEVELLSGDFTYANINLGPNLGGDPFQGFRINNTNGMGNGLAASFALTYTLSGSLQNQQVLARAGSDNLIVTLNVADFEAVRDCGSEEPSDILPYYQPLEGGKSFDIIGSELTSLFFSFSQEGSYISDDIFQVVDDNVFISIVTQPGSYEAALALLVTAEYGLSEEAGDEVNGVISGLFPIMNLLLLNELPDLLISASPVYSALTNAGIVTSQGDIAMRSDFARDGFQVNGQGVKVGVLSDSYNTILGDPAADDVLKGDLPGVDNPDFSTPVDIVKDFPFGSRSDEGRAMLQIIHDIAPGAELAFRTGFLGAIDFAKGIVELQESGCDVIVDDITYISEPFFRDGAVAQAVDEVTALGVTYFSAAGNFGTKSWQGAFTAVDAPGTIEGEAHNFGSIEGTEDIYQSITLSQGDYTVVLQWDDGTPGNTTSSDFDIYLANENGNTLFGFNRVNTGGPPIEVLPFTVAAETAESNFLIVRESGSGPALLKYIVFRGNVVINEYATPNASTITGQANAEGAIAVGAVLFSNTPAYGVDPPTIASFSSRGGTPVDGTVRAKPEISGPNGVNTSVDLGGVNIDGDEFPNFFGTSAAAPHAAAVAALIVEARQKYYGEVFTPAQIGGIMQSTAIDMGTPGFNVESGAGFIQADAALQTLANPAPFITSIAYDSTLVPGIDEILLTVYGQYLNDDSQVWFNGVPIDGTSNLLGDTAITAVIPPFEELYPEIQVFNPPLEGTNGLDGGLSDPLYFTTKETILVTIDGKTKKYGEVLPEFTAVYTLESLDGSTPLEEATLPAGFLQRVYDIPLTTIATPLSNVGLWAIVPGSSDPLNPNSQVPATDSLDLAMLEEFNFSFQNGLMEVSPADLIISPRDTVFTYNDTITGFSFDYIFKNDTLNNFSINPSDSLAIASSLSLAHSTALVDATALVRGTALVNDLGEQILNADALLNTSVLISQTSVQTRGTALVNGELIDAEVLANRLGTTVTGTTSVSVRGTALVNAFSLVRGTALVNSIDSVGNVINTTSLTNSEALVNSSGIMNATSVNLDSNRDALVILGDDDLAILSGDSLGNVTIRSINLITGNTVGTHLLVPGALLTNNFNVSYTLANVTIVPDTAAIAIDAASLNQPYDGMPKSISASVEPQDLELSITYNGEITAPLDAGSYDILVSVNDSNYVGSASALLVISPATATVSTGIYAIDRGQDLPEFEASFSGFINDDGEDVITSITFTVSPNYTTSSPAGIYEVIPNAVAPNYEFMTENGTLYVNPSGPGTKQVKPIFLCSEALDEPNADGFGYLAFFSYENKNQAPVYIPIGEDNLISGGSHDGSLQPELFLTSGGTFTLPYDGTAITWQVTSNRNNGSKGAIPANSSNKQCEAKSGDGTTSAKPANKVLPTLEVFPNPSSGKVYLSMQDENIATGSISVLDNYGKLCKVGASMATHEMIELDLSGLGSGLYIIRIARENGVQVSKVVIY